MHALRIRRLRHALQSARRCRAAPGRDRIEWQQLSHTWRTKHIEYTWHHSLTRTPATFWRLAERSLDFAIAATGVPVGGEVRAGLLATYRAMPPYPEVREVLISLKARGDDVAILSNGDADMLADAVAARAQRHVRRGVVGRLRRLLQARPAGLPTCHRSVRLPAGGGFLPIVQSLGHRRRQGLRFLLRLGEPHGRARRVPRAGTRSRCWRSARHTGARDLSRPQRGKRRACGGQHLAATGARVSLKLLAERPLTAAAAMALA